VGSTKKDLLAMPADVVDLMGYALYLAQAGRTHPQAKPLRGFGGAGVVEIVEDHRGDTYRAVYTTKCAGSIYVLHCFQKKSTHGIATPRHDLRTITLRLRAAEDHARGG
jgi:phage-related protein